MVSDKKFEHPPAHSQGYTPGDIVSPHMLVVLAKHYAEYKKNGKAGDKDGRIAKAYGELRKYGFYPLWLDGERIVWGVALKCPVQIEGEKNHDYYFARGQRIREKGASFGDLVGNVPEISELEKTEQFA